jgi:hypothetical protein
MGGRGCCTGRGRNVTSSTVKCSPRKEKGSPVQRPANDLKRLIEPLGPSTRVTLLAEVCEAGVRDDVISHITEADAENRTALGELIDGGDVARNIPRPPARASGVTSTLRTSRLVRTAIAASTGHVGHVGFSDRLDRARSPQGRSRPSQPPPHAPQARRGSAVTALAPGWQHAVAHARILPLSLRAENRAFPLCQRGPIFPSPPACCGPRGPPCPSCGAQGHHLRPTRRCSDALEPDSELPPSTRSSSGAVGRGSAPRPTTGGLARRSARPRGSRAPGGR